MCAYIHRVVYGHVHLIDTRICPIRGHHRPNFLLSGTVTTKPSSLDVGDGVLPGLSRQEVVVHGLLWVTPKQRKEGRRDRRKKFAKTQGAGTV